MNYQGPATILAVSTAKNGNMYLSITENVIKNISDADTRAFMIDVTTLDVTDSRESEAKPKLHANGAELH